MRHLLIWELSYIGLQANCAELHTVCPIYGVPAKWKIKGGTNLMSAPHFLKNYLYYTLQITRL